MEFLDLEINIGHIDRNLKSQEKDHKILNHFLN